MKTTSKLKAFLIIFFIAIFAIIIARHFIGLHFKKKFSARPAPGVIVSKVEKSLFYKSIETFGTAIAQNSKVYRVQKDNIAGNINIENRFVKKGEIIIALKDGKNIIADFEGKVGKREIAQGVLGSNSLIITLDDLKKIVIDIKIPENYVGILKPGLKAEIINSAFNKTFKGKVESISSRIDPSTRSILARIIVDNSNFEIIEFIDQGKWTYKDLYSFALKASNLIYRQGVKKNETIVVGHKTMNEGSIFQHEVEQYATRSRDVPEHRIEKMVLDSYPSDIELEIIRRGNEVLDDLIGKPPW